MFLIEKLLELFSNSNFSEVKQKFINDLGVKSYFRTKLNFGALGVYKALKLKHLFIE